LITISELNVIYRSLNTLVLSTLGRYLRSVFSLSTALQQN
jgi:hypothetical protein